jgi:hypothetical protein
VSHTLEIIVGAWAAVNALEWTSTMVKDHIAHRREVKEAKRLAALPPKPICECGHSLAFHDPKTGRCLFEERAVVEWKRNEDYDDYEDEEEMLPVRWELKSCGCVRYTGPQPLHTLYAPELSDIAIETPRDREES